MRKFLSAALPLLLCLSLLPACGKGRKKDIPGPNDKVFTVGVAEVVSRDIPDGIEFPGTFTASQRLVVKSDFTGRVQALSVIEGQQVAVNDALMKIDDEKLPYVLDRQRAELREAEAQLEFDSKATGVAGEEEGLEDTGEAQQLEDALAGAGGEEGQADQNAEANPAAQATPEATENTPFPIRRPFGVRRNAKRGLGSPRLPIAAPQSPELTENRIALDQAKVDRIKAEIALSERQLAGSTLLATVEGFVAKVHVAEGSMVKVDDPLVDIVRVDPIELTLHIPKDEIARLDKSMQVKVTVNDMKQESLDGEISFIGAELDPQKKTLEMRIRIPNPGMRIKAGMDGVAHLAVANKTHPALLVPPAAIRSEGDKKFVYVVRGQVAEKREIVTGSGFEGLIEVTKGVKAGERVVIRGLDSLKEDEEFVKVAS
ncbi:efflux RND transporter periplasmic adaptor subunit [Deltaproteobacteria bacterium PRO3]|nr:efflux RND transporter periplasmic adaptor subunit [Deltaproteobacteria bacterium PRO3]